MKHRYFSKKNKTKISQTAKKMLFQLRAIISHNRKFQDLDLVHHCASNLLPSDSFTNTHGFALHCRFVQIHVFHLVSLRLMSKLAYFMLLFLSTAVVVVTATPGMEATGEVRKYLVLALGLASGSLAAWTSFTNPVKRWHKPLGSRKNVEQFLSFAGQGNECKVQFLGSLH